MYNADLKHRLRTYLQDGHKTICIQYPRTSYGIENCSEKSPLSAMCTVCKYPV